MTKPAPLPLTIISSLTGIAACALLSASEVRADPYVVTIDQVGNNVVATGSGAINTSGLTPAGPTTVTGFVVPFVGLLTLGSGGLDQLSGATGPSTFGSGTGGLASSNDGLAVTLQGAAGRVNVPSGYQSGTTLAPSESTWNNQSLASLGITPGTYVWTWGNGARSTDQSFTIDVVPGPIVGAGLPGLIAVLGGLVAMARRRQKQFA